MWKQAYTPVTSVYIVFTLSDQTIPPTISINAIFAKPGTLPAELAKSMGELNISMILRRMWDGMRTQNMYMMKRKSQRNKQ